MKQFFIILLLISLPLFSGQRVVVLEEYTSAT